MKIAKIIAIIFIGILILNLVLIAFGVITLKIFWAVIIISFIASYTLKKVNWRQNERRS
mgnify:CR=1 FL=1